MTRTIFAASSLLFVLATLALPGCDGPADGKTDEDNSEDSSSEDTYTIPVDADGDGVTVADGDCDDADPALYPGRGEDCDGLDNNCNSVVDEGLPDADDDGTADCVDVEECDGVDNDGDSEIDEGYPDSDGNGSADCVGTEECDGLDNNGDGRVDEGFDADADGATQCGSSTAVADCNDADATISPGASEAPGDFLDNDCDGLVDEGMWAEGDLAVSEILANPGRVSDPHGEWFEIYNTTDQTLILNGLVISSTIDGEEHQVSSPDLLFLEPGDFFVFGSNDDSSVNGDVVVDYVYEDVVLSNESDELVLVADGVVIDTVIWDNGFSMPDPDGASIGTDLGHYDAILNDDPMLWCAATIRWTEDPTSDKGSPGAGNEYCTTFDHDGDGYTGADGDCNEEDSTTYPGAWEGSDTSDNDCDGVDETAPTGVATSTGTGFSCDDIALSSAGSWDYEEGYVLTFAWELTSAPETSARTTADLVTPTSANPTFNPDVAGTYVFTLTVNDGGTDSMPVSVSVTVETRGTNGSPTAVAGVDQTASATATCSSISYGTAWSCDDCSALDFTLSAAGSSDPDGDDLTYAWSITSGSDYGVLDGSTGESVGLNMTAVPATYGEATTQTVDVLLVATDCMGVSATDTVQVSYTCTGS